MSKSNKTRTPKKRKKRAVQKKGIKISACMMVKDEEEMLERCLSSVHHLVDEIIVVDTGSTDRTVEIAESFGAKIFHHPWEHDFSKHRNQSISYATGDWFLTIDADEELDAQHLTKKELKKHLQKMPAQVHCLLVTLRNKDRKGNIDTVTKIPRLFKNGVGVEFRGIVHNTPHYTGKVTDIDLNLFHYGYALSEEQMQTKYRRTSSLLHRRIKNDPNDFQAYFYLCQVYMEMEERHKAIEYGYRCLEKLPLQEKSAIEHSFYHSLYHAIAIGHIQLKEYDEALAVARKGLKLLPEEVDLYYDLACIGHFSKNLNLTIEGAENYLRVVEKFRQNPMLAGTRFIFSTSKKFQTTVEFWLMSAYLAIEKIDGFYALWNQNRNQLANEEVLLDKFLTELERSDRLDVLESVVNFLFGRQQQLNLTMQKNLLSHAIFFAKKNDKEDDLESSILKYLDLTVDYKEIPTDTAIIIAEFFLKKQMGDFFLDITIVLFKKLLSKEIKSIKGINETAHAYGLIADKQPETGRGILIGSICLKIAWWLTEDDTYLARRGSQIEGKNVAPKS